MQAFLFRVRPGWMAGAWSESGLVALTLPQPSQKAALLELGNGLRTSPCSLAAATALDGRVQELIDEMERYFRGEKVTFSAAVDWSGYTPFQRRVLEVTRAIPYGEVRSYGQIARQAGSPKGARAVGGVMRANRTPLVVPCHRVIASTGSLGGFGGGLQMKKYLLTLEKVQGREGPVDFSIPVG
ncbi:MAG: methylated-DNA--[protein]-cysteine S-methyltransferase [Pelotomaculum sp.]|uniref:methylated-DNA--[protein]-cysteine S-methyltransferase n=1 Tax=Pelotomaculum thermopropionicum (strain DSM 13744 / JCM 10971 / SI) TaxID=370438 RepID=A5CZ01_PELTS|nr:methylated-DNA--[protein]-cysteine S-methyltransferase [Pelotomaculum sp.]BAF60784.1 hypothetical protein PTH_2603 [Pelotomaculum thermopropionicum SI]